MTRPNLVLAGFLAAALAGTASAQGLKTPDPGYDQGGQCNQAYPSQAYPSQGYSSQRPAQGFNEGPSPQANRGAGQQEGFNFSGDQIAPAPDQRRPSGYDPRYSQTDQQRQAEAQKPGGGCLRYGAVGAAGGHLAGHGVLGAVAGCAVGAMVRKRDKARIEQESAH